MTIARTGLILYVKKYEECLSFYGDTLELDVLFQNDDLCCFDFFGSYLMVEKEDRSDYLNRKDELKNFNCIRMNVANVEAYASWLAQKKVAVDYQQHTWGEVAKFNDPDGNLLAFKDEAGFLEQLQAGDRG